MPYPQLIYPDTGDGLDIGLPGGPMHAAGHAEATYRTSPGAPLRDDALFTFPGTNFVFNHHLGMRTRPIDWWGDIRCSDAGLVLLRARRDLVMFQPGAYTFVDDDGTAYYGCIPRSFTLGGKQRMQDRGLLRWIVAYRITLEQLEP